MKKIKLTQNKVALVDDEDFEKLNKFKWYCCDCKTNYYAQRQIRIQGKRQTIHMHKEVLNTLNQIDHIDQNGLNNQKYNLRESTSVQNSINKKAYLNKTSKYKGIHITKNGTYNIQLKIDYKSNSLGTLANEILAAKYYDAAVRFLYGEYAWCNFKEEYIKPRPIIELKKEIKNLPKVNIRVTNLLTNKIRIDTLNNIAKLYKIKKKTILILIRKNKTISNRIFTYEP